MKILKVYVLGSESTLNWKLSYMEIRKVMTPMCLELAPIFVLLWVKEDKKSAVLSTELSRICCTFCRCIQNERMYICMYVLHKKTIIYSKTDLRSLPTVKTLSDELFY